MCSYELSLLSGGPDRVGEHEMLFRLPGYCKLSRVMWLVGYGGNRFYLLYSAEYSAIIYHLC